MVPPGRHISVNVEGDYLIACARIRDVTVTELVRRLVGTIERDQLVLAILDDEDCYRARERYQHRFRSDHPPQALSSDVARK